MREDFVGHHRPVLPGSGGTPRRMSVANSSTPGKPLRSSAGSLSDDELLAKLRSFGLEIHRDGVERLCAGALSAEEVAAPILDKLELGDERTVDWLWISLLALWQRWWPALAKPGTPGRQDPGRLRPRCRE